MSKLDNKIDHCFYVQICTSDYTHCAMHSPISKRHSNPTKTTERTILNDDQSTNVINPKNKTRFDQRLRAGKAALTDVKITLEECVPDNDVEFMNALREEMKCSPNDLNRQRSKKRKRTSIVDSFTKCLDDQRVSQADIAIALSTDNKGLTDMLNDMERYIKFKKMNGLVRGSFSIRSGKLCNLGANVKCDTERPSIIASTTFKPLLYTSSLDNKIDYKIQLLNMQRMFSKKKRRPQQAPIVPTSLPPRCALKF